MAVTHIAAPHIIINDRYLRQRCGWCGAVIIEYDLAAVAVPAGTDPTPATWSTGALVAVDGRASWAASATNRLPEDACGVNPLTMVGFGTGDSRG
ncbi:hypothetical protein E1258_09600 [Micromonospora sp. KC207]|uniref:hypothetical protein n=1 Tax=Micromonospora sp. KC207 TaxID=2530377 RepID=UPI00104386CB|nr:hypothetical protein [Micromonospora sp. KC207]TDC63890.1 hypothetical protein E1258_09600 [Micromonospora sp. KC207]